MVRRDSGITSPAQLAGRKVVTVKGGTREANLRKVVPTVAGVTFGTAPRRSWRSNSTKQQRSSTMKCHSHRSVSKRTARSAGADLLLGSCALVLAMPLGVQLALARISHRRSLRWSVLHSSMSCAALLCSFSRDRCEDRTVHDHADCACDLQWSVPGRAGPRRDPESGVHGLSGQQPGDCSPDFHLRHSSADLGDCCARRSRGGLRPVRLGKVDSDPYHQPLGEVDTGAILVDGQAIHRRGIQVDRFRSGIGFVFQQFNLFSQLTVLENCTLAPIHSRGLTTTQSRAKAMLERVGVLIRPAYCQRNFQGVNSSVRRSLARSSWNHPSCCSMSPPAHWSRE
jgi:hypothetical protein